MEEGGDAMETHTTYEEYLDSQITDTDMFYLESEDLARQLVELGYRGSGDTLKREEFEARKKALRERSTQKVRVRRDPATPFIQVLPHSPLLTLFLSSPDQRPKAAVLGRKGPHRLALAPRPSKPRGAREERHAHRSRDRA